MTGVRYDSRSEIVLIAIHDHSVVVTKKKTRPATSTFTARDYEIVFFVAAGRKHTQWIFDKLREVESFQTL